MIRFTRVIAVGTRITSNVAMSILCVLLQFGNGVAGIITLCAAVQLQTALCMHSQFVGFQMTNARGCVITLVAFEGFLSCMHP